MSDEKGCAGIQVWPCPAYNSVIACCPNCSVLRALIERLGGQLAALFDKYHTLVALASDVAESAGLEFADPRVGYETWQVDAGAMQALQKRLRSKDEREVGP